jgi:hypothetical protein
MKYDLIIVAASKDESLRKMTQQAIDSCLADGADVNVILVETFKQHPYANVNTTVFFDGEFNYNRCLNLGLKHRMGDVQILANNDIIFEPGWSIIGATMRNNDYLSASALSNSILQRGFKRGDFAYEGYSIGTYFTGWCLFADSRVWELIGRLDETHQFWFSDNVYADQLRLAGIKHFLICNVIVLHYVSRTLATEDYRTKRLYTSAARKAIHKRHR